MSIQESGHLYMADLGRKLKLARVAKGLSQHELAEKIHKTRPLISHIELTGKVNPDTLDRICKVLNIRSEDMENSLKEKGLHYESASEKSQKKEIERLKEDILLLKDYISSQKEIIAGLREKIEAGKKKRRK